MAGGNATILEIANTISAKTMAPNLKLIPVSQSLKTPILIILL
jgi:hypothetical protein